MIIVNRWKPLTIITKSSILDFAAVLDPPLSLSHKVGSALLYEIKYVSLLRKTVVSSIGKINLFYIKKL